MGNVITTKGLTKKYGHKTIIEDINLSINKGDIYGLIGRNGAGKTTLMRMLLGMTDVTRGDIILLENRDLEIGRGKTGSIIEIPTFYDKMTAFQNMKIKAKLLGLKDANKKIDEALKEVDLYEVKSEKPGKFSLGMRQRLGIAVALLGEPEILILDEPINGLDPIAISEVRNILKDINQKRDVTILISSHILGEIGKLATRYGFIVNGKLTGEITQATVVEKNIDIENYFLELIGGK